MVYDGEVLPLTKVSRNEMGAYLCIATNGVPPSKSKRIILDVECEFNGTADNVRLRVALIIAEYAQFIRWCVTQ